MSHTIRYRSSSARRRGLGMAELLISLAITSLLLVGVAAAYSASTSAMNANDQFFRASRSARVSMNRILTEVRRCQSGVTDATSLELITEGGQRRVYRFDAGGRRLTVTFPDLVPAKTYTLARDVESAEFFTEAAGGQTISLLMTVQAGNDRVSLSGSAMPRRTFTFQ